MFLHYLYLLSYVREVLFVYAYIKNGLEQIKCR